MRDGERLKRLGARDVRRIRKHSSLPTPRPPNPPGRLSCVHFLIAIPSCIRRGRSDYSTNSQRFRFSISKSLVSPGTIPYQSFTMTERTYNVAVIGYGLSSQVFMIPFLSSQLKLYAIVQRNPTNENDTRRDHPNVKLYRGCDEMLKDKAVDLVVVATPPPTHFTLCKEALEAGKHGTLDSTLSRNLF